MSIIIDKEIQETIKYGDHVLFYFTAFTMQFEQIEEGKTFHNEFIKINHSEIVGKKFGTKIGTNRTGYFYPLKPTPELWTANLSKRTQILYSADISLIISNLSLIPGSIVVESGTGSGSLTTNLARSVAPNGHIYTFEYNKDRAEAAKEDFKINNLSSLITVQQGDVCSLGFLNIPKKADALFLDLPSPWKALNFAKEILTPSAKICSFSPCIEQVSRVCTELRSLGFIDIVTFEVLQRKFDVSTPLLEEFPLYFDETKKNENENENNQQKTENQNNEFLRELKVRKVETEGKKKKKKNKKEIPKQGDIAMAVPTIFSRGHTGYLTFARLIPIEISQQKHQIK